MDGWIGITLTFTSKIFDILTSVPTLVLASAGGAGDI